MSPVAKALTDRERTARMIGEAIEAERNRCARVVLNVIAAVQAGQIVVVGDPSSLLCIIRERISKP